MNLFQGEEIAVILEISEDGILRIVATAAPLNRPMFTQENKKILYLQQAFKGLSIDTKDKKIFEQYISQYVEMLS